MKAKQLSSIWVGVLLIFLFVIQIFPPILTNDVTSLRHFFISLFVIVGGGFLLFSLLRNKNKVVSVSSFPVIKFWLLLILFMFVSILWAINRIESLVVVNRWLLVLMMAFLLIVFLSDKTKRFHIFVYSAMVLALINVITCIASYYYLNCADFPNKIPMINGGYGNKNIFAVCMMFKLPFLYYAFFRYKKVFRFLSLFLIFAICFCLPIISTRSAYICLVLNVLILLIYSLLYLVRLRKRSYFLKSCLIILFLIGGFVLGGYFVTYNYAHGKHKQENSFDVSQRIKETGTGKSSKARIGIWKNTITIIKERPFSGYGVGNYKVAIMKVETPQKHNFQVSDHAHNDFLEMCSELGIIGLLLYISIYLSMFVIGVKIIFARRTKEPYRLLALLSLMLLFTYGNDALFNFPNERATPQIYLAISVGIMGMVYFKYKEMTKKQTKTLSLPVAMVFVILSLPLTAIESIHAYSSKIQYDRIICYNSKNKDHIPPSYWQRAFPKIPNIDESTRPIAISIGNMYAQQGDYRTAIDIVLNDNSNPYLASKENALAQWYYALDNVDSCIYFADKCLAMKPKHFPTLKIKLNLLRKHKQGDKAMQILDEYIKEHYLNHRAWCEKINTYIKQENYSMAKQTVNQALEFLPKEKHILKKQQQVDSLFNTSKP
ncbi:MAG: O-antigen ligase family protein [Bacteroidota bacterium]|nr:O-antigen ligase family protein [Bacteroidota bacterium]